MPTRIAIIGSRNFDDYEFFCIKLDYHLRYVLGPFIIISGGAKGADSLAERFAKERGFEMVIHRPDWDIGKHAGFIRNQKIINDSDWVIAFWDGKSRGTEDSIIKAKHARKNIIVVFYKQRTKEDQELIFS